MTDKPIIFIDTETTSLRHDRRAWEIAVIVRRPDQMDHEQAWFIDVTDLDLGAADLASLKFGRFFDRHPGYGDSDVHQAVMPEANVLDEVERLTRGGVLMGSNPAFDTELLAGRMRAHGICPSWHYRVEDVPTMALGWLYGAGWSLPEDLRSDQISKSVGVDPADYDRHTALGDCRWIRDLYDQITAAGGTSNARPSLAA